MIAIGEAARQSGVSIETIRYYERERVVPAPRRAANGRRVYSDKEVGRLRFIRRCRDLGFSISEAKGLLSLSEGENSNCAKVKEIGTAHLNAVRCKIAELTALEAALEELTANCRSGSVSCQMLEALAR
ncbi:helix-turn-helix domain-containing protein [Roseobacter sp. YSTF-M11]|uniref:Helix-turn-helix domain-containing protein n=1 Tax=Roseobacter insulae TaxID=2859783 RepID=A0A9X1JY92_9RHOB|nr:helix-turn-helix domain-containing protein [Roseobacter insulae]MBW4707956.1 helix-turn-helix domain-containing protein [Roseobacter insulae]